jgi:hypothetical protein
MMEKGRREGEGGILLTAYLCQPAIASVIFRRAEGGLSTKKKKHLCVKLTQFGILSEKA